MLSKINSVSYSLACGLADTMTIGSGLEAITGNTALAFSIGAAIGAYTVFSEHSFLSNVLLLKNKLSQLASNNSPENEETVSYERQVGYWCAKYGNIIIHQGTEFFHLILRYRTIKGWGSALWHGGQESLGTFSLTEGLLVGAYYLNIDLTYNLMAKGMEAGKTLKAYFKLAPNKNYEPPLVNKLSHLISPFTNSVYFYRGHRIVGSISDTISHMAPVPMNIPPDILRNFVTKQPLQIVVPVLVAGGLVFLYSTGVQFSAAYLFEGRIAERNIKQIGSLIEADMVEEPQELGIFKYFAKPLHPSLHLISVIKAADNLCTLMYPFQDKGMPIQWAFLTAIIPSIAIGLGTYIEVKGAQDELMEMKATQTASEEMQLIESGASFFKRSNYHLKNKDGTTTVVPTSFKQDSKYLVKNSDGTTTLVPASFKRDPNYGSFTEAELLDNYLESSPMGSKSSII